ncbi:hypothetical protein, partial [Metabacillus rhizolycopersici]
TFASFFIVVTIDALVEALFLTFSEPLFTLTYFVCVFASGVGADGVDGEAVLVRGFVDVK